MKTPDSRGDPKFGLQEWHVRSTTHREDWKCARVLAARAADVDELNDWLAMLGLSPERLRAARPVSAGA